MGLARTVKNCIPSPGWKPLLGAFLFQCLAFSGTRLLNAGWYHWDMTTALDRATPFLPWTVAVYAAAFLFWTVNYNLIVSQGGLHAWRFLAADILGKVICLVIFLAMPTANVRPEIPADAALGWGMRIIYALDTPDNLFPSIHCFNSWICWAGVRGRRNIPAGCRLFSLLFALAIALSTLTTKQHVIADVIGGFGMGELCWQLAGRTALARLYRRVWRMEEQEISS